MPKLKNKIFNKQSSFFCSHWDDIMIFVPQFVEHIDQCVETEPWC